LLISKTILSKHMGVDGSGMTYNFQFVNMIF
jgi:hypothetical protein